MYGGRFLLPGFFTQTLKFPHQRIDLWSSDIAFQRMLSAIESLNHDPVQHEQGSLLGRELILQGTQLRDVLLQSFSTHSAGDQDPPSLNVKASEGNSDAPVLSVSTSIQSASYSARQQAGAFAENIFVQSWADRYSRPDPVVVEGDPILNLNESQVRAVATMIGKRASLVQGVSNHVPTLHLEKLADVLLG